MGLAEKRLENNADRYTFSMDGNNQGGSGA